MKLDINSNRSKILLNYVRLQIWYATDEQLWNLLFLILGKLTHSRNFRHSYRVSANGTEGVQ